MRRRASLALLVLALVLAPAAAQAHLGHVILRAERYLKIDASEQDTRVVVSLTLGASEGARVLAAADANGDHEVSQAESDAYLAQWGEGLGTDLPIEIDGSAFAATWTEGYLEPIGPVGPTPLTVEITAHLPLTGREHLVRVRDHMRREVFDRTDVAFRAHDGGEIVRCGPGQEPTGTQNDFSYGASAGGDAPPDVLTAQLRFPRRADSSAGIALPIAALLAVALGLVFWRRRKR
jgi:hypothetical protein